MHQRDHQAIIEILHAYHQAMLDGRTDTLDGLLDRGFTLTHITGYVQPRQEWFGVIQSGEFDYHSISLHEASVRVSASGDGASVAGKGIFDATINGMHAPWRLRFEIMYRKRDEVWRIASARYISF